SKLLCQEFTDSKGNPLNQYFQPRPSNAIPAGAKNDYGCDPTQSGGSNLGTNASSGDPKNPSLLETIVARRAAQAQFDSVAGYTVTPDQVATDAVTASGSGLDPDITPLNAHPRDHGGPGRRAGQGEHRRPRPRLPRRARRQRPAAEPGPGQAVPLLRQV